MEKSTIITDLANLLRRKKAEPEQPLSTSEKLDRLQSEAQELEAGLRKIDEGRAETQKAINDISARRRGLLLEEGTDAKIAEADKQLDRLRLTLERFDELEPTILNRLRELGTDQRSVTFEQIKLLYSASVSDYCDVMEEASQKRRNIVELRDLISRAGFENLLHLFPVPAPGLPTDLEDIGRFRLQSVEGMNHFSMPALGPTLYQVRMLQQIGLYRTGEIAGFTLKEASQYVELGFGEYVDARQAAIKAADDRAQKA